MFIGTFKDNTQDMMKKGRNKSGMKMYPERAAKGERHGSKTHPECLLRGEENPISKLTAPQVMEIRNRVKSGMRQDFLAKEFGVSKATICRAVRGHCWKHLPQIP